MGQSKTLLILALVKSGVCWGGLKHCQFQFDEDGSLAGWSKTLLILALVKSRVWLGGLKHCQFHLVKSGIWWGGLKSGVWWRGLKHC